MPTSDIPVRYEQNNKISAILLDLAAKIQVPHSWFTHYYIISVLSSFFWAYQLITRGNAFLFLASLYAGDAEASMTMNQIVLVWLFMTLQGCRRLYECATLLKSSAAKMPISSWALGVAFYLIVGVSIWVEGIRKSWLPFKSYSDIMLIRVATLLKDRLSPKEVSISMPSLKAFIAVPLFLLASGIQRNCHEYLSRLKKYALPEHPLFLWVICPHYTSECVIYLALAIVAAPSGHLLNKTISAVLLFTAVNLAITAESTRVWYSQKFGADKIKERWRMVPFLY
jgi:3-oxo-5-alpha-steroid 4-dehydrogenase 3